MSKWIGWKSIYESEELKTTPYLTRAWIGRLYFHIFHRGDADPDPHDHPRAFWTFPLTSYVEEVTTIHKDRPWNNKIASATTHLHVVKAFRLHYRPAEYTHRVLGRYAGVSYGFDPTRIWPFPVKTAQEVSDRRSAVLVTDKRKVITIVWWKTKRYTREWGFLKNRDGAWCWVAWKDYVFGGGKHGPCE